jgi:hypothetical protein
VLKQSNIRFQTRSKLNYEFYEEETRLYRTVMEATKDM